MNKVYTFEDTGRRFYHEPLLMNLFVSNLLGVSNGFMTESYEINDNQSLDQKYAIYRIPGHLDFMFEADYIPESDSCLTRYTVLEEIPNSEVAKAFHLIAKILEGGLENFFSIKLKHPMMD